MTTVDGRDVRRRPDARLRPPHRRPGVARQRCPRARPQRRLGLPLVRRRRPNGRRLEIDPGAVALGAARPRALRPSAVHQRPLPLPDRSAARPRREPDRDHRRTFTRPDWDVERVLLRFDGVESVYRVVLNGIEVGVGKGSRLVQEFDVTDALVPGAQRARRAGAPVVVDELRRGPGPVVAAGHLPRRHPAGPPARRAGRRVAARRRTTTAGIDRPGDRRGGDRSRSPSTIPELGVRQVFTGPDDLAPFHVGAVEPWTRRDAAALRRDRRARPARRCRCGSASAPSDRRRAVLGQRPAGRSSAE